MRTLYEEVTDWMYAQQCKHDLGVEYVADTVNDMTQIQLLEALSEGMDHILAERDMRLKELTARIEKLERAPAHQD